MPGALIGPAEAAHTRCSDCCHLVGRQKAAGPGEVQPAWPGRSSASGGLYSKIKFFN